MEQNERRTSEIDGKDELQLVIKAKEGDKQAIEKLFGTATNEKSLTSFITKVVTRRMQGRPWQEIQDVIQDVNVQILKSLETFSGTGSFRAWVVSIILKVLANHWDKNRKSNEIFVSSPNGDESKDESNMEWAPDRWDDTDPDTAVTDEQSKAVVMLFHELVREHFPENQQLYLIEYYLTYDSSISKVELEKKYELPSSTAGDARNKIQKLMQSALGVSP